MLRFSFLGIALILAGCATADTIYTDQSAWESAVAALPNEATLMPNFAGKGDGFEGIHAISLYGGARPDGLIWNDKIGSGYDLPNDSGLGMKTSMESLDHAAYGFGGDWIIYGAQLTVDGETVSPGWWGIVFDTPKADWTIDTTGTTQYDLGGFEVSIDPPSDATATPEPGTLSMMFAAGLGLVALGRKRLN